ncbi:hypothetical protein JYT93_00875, partial [bacterium AH-315-J19]|nr:hypothetical protein [bacterium AH-315-J19]
DPDDDGESDDGDGAVETFVCDEQEYTLPPGFVALPTPPGNPWYPLMQNPQTGEILHTPWYAEEMEQFRNNYDWGLFLRNLAGIGVASVSGVGAAQFQAWTLPAGSGLAVLEGPLPYPEGWEPPGC